MTLLAIDTSSAYASVALFDGHAVLAETTWHAQRRHDDHLFPEIERMLGLGGVAIGDIAQVAVAIGPGSFTGVRVAIAAAQGIARASGAGAIPVTTLDIAARPFASSRTRVCALIPAGRGEHYAAMYRERHGTWQCTSGIAIGTIADLARAIAMDTVFVGEIDDATVAELHAVLGERAAVAPASARLRRAGHLAQIGWERAAAGAAVAPEALEPLYIRAPLIRGRSGELIGDAGAAPPAPALRGNR
jgi:tRNA threonylcarbamoyladenosine biosynthesis protein TsaB